MKLTPEQDQMLCKAFMTAMAKRLYRNGDIDAAVLNRLTIKIDKIGSGTKAKGAATRRSKCEN